MDNDARRARTWVGWLVRVVYAAGLFAAGEVLAQAVGPGAAIVALVLAGWCSWHLIGLPPARELSRYRFPVYRWVLRGPPRELLTPDEEMEWELFQERLRERFGDAFPPYAPPRDPHANGTRPGGSL